MKITSEHIDESEIPERASRSGKWADYVRLVNEEVKEGKRELPQNVSQEVVNEFGAKQVSSSLRNALKNAKINDLVVQQSNNRVFLKEAE